MPEALKRLLISLNGAADQLETSRQTIRRGVKTGAIKAVLVARRVMIPVAEVERIATQGLTLQNRRGKKAGKKEPRG